MNSIELYSQILSDNLLTLKNSERKFRYSDFLLFSEYQTRLLTWKRKLKPDFINFFDKNKSFHNLFVDLFPSGVKGFITEEKIISDLKASEVKDVRLTHRDYYGFFICMYINWEIFKNLPEIEEYGDLPHPYETIFKMLLRGGTIFNSEKRFEIDNRTYLKHDGKFILPSLDCQFLDYIDKSCQHVPDQNEVNQLWAKFIN